MEELREAIERIRRAEVERLAALFYLSWLPPMSLGLYLTTVTKSWLFVATLWAVGFIPYAWTVANFSKFFGKGDKGWLAFPLWFGVGSIVGAVTGEWAWGVAIGIGGGLFTSSLLETYRSRWVDAASGAGLVVLTVLGSFFTNPWNSFMASAFTVYSFASLAHLIYGVYEVIPYVTKKG